MCKLMPLKNKNNVLFSFSTLHVHFAIFNSISRKSFPVFFFVLMVYHCSVHKANFVFLPSSPAFLVW